MSSTAPAQNDDRALEQPEEKLFDPLSFPADLIASQRELAETFTELHTLQARLPWSREPHVGWSEETERGREHPGRPASPGWEPADAEAFDRLMARLRELAQHVQWHRHWADCREHGVDIVAARQALKQAAGIGQLA